MAFEKDPNEIGVIFVGAGTGKYEGNLYFSGKAFPVEDGTYRLENFYGTSRKTGKEFNGIRVIRVEADEQYDPQEEIERAKAAIDAEHAPF